MKAKHLVLDGDVHERLKDKKSRTGMTVREIGNSALRAALSLPTQHQLVLGSLLAEGKITRRDYEEACAAVDGGNPPAKDAIEDMFAATAVEPEVMVHGSWAARMVSRAPDGSWQTLEAWAHDGARTLTSMHVYRKTRAYGVVLTGKLRVDVDGETKVIAAPGMFHFPVGTACATAPLTKKTRILLTFVPAVM